MLHHSFSRSCFVLLSGLLTLPVFAQGPPMQRLLSPDDVPIAKQFAESLKGACESCVGETVVVDIPTIITFSGTTPRVIGDPDLFFLVSFEKVGEFAHQWKAIIDVGARALNILSNAGIIVQPVDDPLGTASPSLVRLGYCTNWINAAKLF